MASDERIEVPASACTVDVRIIDTTARLQSIPFSAFAGPDLEGFERFNCPAYGFLITHTESSTGNQRRVVFDLGPPKDWENDLPLPLVEGIKQWNATFRIDKYVSEVLVDHNVPLETIEAVIWSHAHFDHIGRPSLFPASTKLITGPGIKEAFFPGYPQKENSIVLSREFRGREVEELDFTKAALEIGSFKALDFFGDGSFYLLLALGHAIGHVNALARTTADPESTFILMGADSFHHGSQLRPHRHFNLPTELEIPGLEPYPCPGHMFHSIHPMSDQNIHKVASRYLKHFTSVAESENRSDPDPNLTPFFTICESLDGKSLANDLPAARSTIQALQNFDADDRIFIVAAHDMSLLDVLEYFPSGANQWKEKGWKQDGRWRFLRDFKKALGIATKQ